MKSSESFFNSFLGRLVIVWMSFNFLILLMKLNGLDHEGNIAWRVFLSPLWRFDLFLLYSVLIGAALLVFYFSVEFIVENLPSTKRKAILAKQALEFEAREKNRLANDRLYDEARTSEREQLWQDACHNAEKAKTKLEADQCVLVIAQSKTKDEIKNELLNSLTGRRP